MRNSFPPFANDSFRGFRGLGKAALWGLALWIFGSSAAFSQNTELIFGRKDTYGIGPRAMGMGDAFTAVADDSSAAYWNVAGLAQLTAYEISVSSAPVYFQDNVNGLPAFGYPWFASLQLMLPIAKDNTLGLSFFRPFHPQGDIFASDQTLDPGARSEKNYLYNPTFQEDEIVLSFATRFSAIRNFSIGVNIKQINNDPYYIRYFGQDQGIKKELENPIKVTGYGVDLGVLYRIPITKYSEEFRIGLALNDLVARASYPNGLQIIQGSVPPPTPPTVPVTLFSPGPGFETQIPPEINIGVAYKNDYLFKLRNITALDFDQISDPRFGDDQNKYLRFGTEFWLFKDALGIRAGYSTPFSSPGTLHTGLSIRALNGDFQTDMAFLFPISPSASVSEGSAIGTYDTGGINFEPFHIGASFRFGGGQELPPPKVDAFVKPESFAPSQGEKATFYLDTTEDVTIHHWTVLIYDQNNHLVRGLRGSGSPPTKLVWGGESDTYEPLPPGTYNWAFQVQDNLGHVGSTPVQTVEILGPPGAEPARDPSKLLALRKQQAALLAQERQKLTTLAEQNLKQLLGEPEATTGTAEAQASPTPLESNGNTMTPEAGGVPSLGFNNISQDAVLNTHFDKNANGEPIVSVSYRSDLTYVPYLYQEAAEVIKTTVNSVGTGLKELSTRVYYGKNELTLVTPSQAAANYASGKIDQLTLLQLSDIHINGEKVGPNGY